jgi:hypothetical protein
VRLDTWGVAPVVFRQHNGTAKKFLHTMGGFTLGYCPPFTGRGLQSGKLLPRPALFLVSQMRLHSGYFSDSLSIRFDE